MRLDFGPFHHDPDAHELRRGDARLELSPKAFALLGLLLEARPRVLSHEELHDRLWPDSHVARTSLARLVTEIRHALGDEAGEPRYVRNVHGVGYAFCGEAAPAKAGDAAAAAVFSCSLIWGAHEIGLREGDNLVGRTPDCAVRIDSPQVSRHHARVRVTRGQASVEDLGSKNGTHVEGVRIDRARLLEDGETVCVGPALMVFRRGYGAGSTKTG